MNNITRYVAGFVFSPSFEQVGLIRKNKPVWQAGLLNGIGGKIEENETPVEAMVREFSEETLSTSSRDQWKQFAVIGDDKGFEVTFFAMIGATYHLRPRESEQVEVLRVRDIHPLRTDMIENLPWLIAMAIDHMQDGRPTSANITYPQ